MNRGGLSKTLPTVLIIIVMIIAIGALISVGRSVFTGSKKDVKEQVDVAREALLDTSLDHSVEMTVRGRLVSNEAHRSYQVTISAASRSLVTYKGYLDSVLDSKRLSNNSQAYEQFVFALDKANYVKGDELTGEANDTRGICASGQVYEFSVIDNNKNKPVKRLWTSTCKGSPGSLDANAGQLRELFLDQIPDYQKLLGELDL